MFIDNKSKLRKALLRMINTPKNEEIVYYNAKFIDLINVNVEKLYEDEVAKFKEIEQEYDLIKKKIDDYNAKLEILGNSNKKMTEVEHIEKIQELEIIYAKKYRDVKTLENKIEIHKGKIENINNKIKIQQTKELKELSQKKQSIMSEKDKIKGLISNIKTLLVINEKASKFSSEKLETEQKKYFYVDKYGEAIKNGTFTCEYCKGHISSRKTKDTLLKENEEEKQILLKQIDLLTKECEQNNYEKLKLQHDMNKLKADLKNLEQIDSQDLFRYEKKSLEILKLEASKFRLLEEMQEIDQICKEKIEKYGDDIQKLKLQIETYKQSLMNLQEIKQAKLSLTDDIKDMQKLEEQMKKMKADILFHCEFIATKNKLIQKRLSELFDLKLRFELFEQSGIVFKEKMKIYYDNVDIIYVSPEIQREINKIICDKISLFNEEE